MTDFHVDTVRLGKIETHPNADLLEITYVHGGYPCVIRKGAFKEGDLATYIPIDTSLPDSEHFKFLSSGDRRRLKAKKLRGIFSMGLIIPPLDNSVEGDDVSEAFGITKFDPDLCQSRSLGGDCEVGPEGWIFHRYTDIEPLRRNGNVLVEGEEIILTEKLHGSNFRAVHDGNRLWIGSKTQIKKPTEAGLGEPIWWQIARKFDLESKLSKHPMKIFFGEVFGFGVQDLRYGLKTQSLRIFDVLDATTISYLNFDDAHHAATSIGLEWVPLLYRGPWNKDELVSLCNGKTTLDVTSESHVREGFVARPVKERWNQSVGRVVLKMVGDDYYLRKEK